jgi:hypothetical protein
MSFRRVGSSSKQTTSAKPQHGGGPPQRSGSLSSGSVGSSLADARIAGLYDLEHTIGKCSSKTQK